MKQVGGTHNNWHGEFFFHYFFNLYSSDISKEGVIDCRCYYQVVLYELTVNVTLPTREICEGLIVAEKDFTSG